MRVLLILVVLTGCGHKAVKDAPYVPAKLIEVPVPTYVPIPPPLTARCLIAADGTVTSDPKVGRPLARGVPPSQAIRAARERMACVDFYEANDDATEAVQGQPAPKD
jgi:hypothetical protein